MRYIACHLHKIYIFWEYGIALYNTALIYLSLPSLSYVQISLLSNKFS